MHRRRWMRKGLGMLIVLAGSILTLYPWISNQWYQRHVDSAVEIYQEELKQVDDTGVDQYMEAARAYNQRLSKAHVRITDPFTEDGSAGDLGYGTVLSLDSQGTMGFLEIPGIQVKLPIYHGTSEEVLQKGIGHIQGTALPVGGVGNRSVLSGHTGLNSAKMLTDLTEMEEGDLFFLRILNEVLAYRVCDIQVIQPDETEILAPEEGRDLVTLLTCTPYGVNSHRLVVTGERVPYSREEQAAALDAARKPEDTLWVQAYRQAILMGMGGGALLILAVWGMGRPRNRRRRIGLLVILLGLGIFFYPEIRTGMVNRESRRVIEEFRVKSYMKSEADVYPEIGTCLGYIEIPALSLVLPLYYGTNDTCLAKGAGVLEDSSLPTGGMGRNCVIAGHRGYRGAPYFREIQVLREGDLIYLTNETCHMTYEVASTAVIEPTDRDAIAVQEDRDMITLLTCHPYRSHGRYRYLVYCDRIEEERGNAAVGEENPEKKIEQGEGKDSMPGKIWENRLTDRKDTWKEASPEILQEDCFRIGCGVLLLYIFLRSIRKGKARE